MAALSQNLAILGHERYAQAGIITATSEQPAFGASHLAGTALWGTVWRSAEGSLSNIQVKLDLGVARTIQSLVLVGTNFSLDMTRAVVFSNNADLSAPVFSLAESPGFDASLSVLRDDTPPWGRHLIYLHTAGTLTARYAAFTIWDPNNVDGFLRASIGLAEPIWQPVRNMDKGWERGGRLEGDPGVEQHLREHQIPLQRLLQGEERKVLSLTRSLKSTGRLFVIPEPLAPSTWLQDAIWGRFIGSSGRATAVDNRGRFRTLSLGFQEVDE